MTIFSNPSYICQGSLLGTDKDEARLTFLNKKNLEPTLIYLHLHVLNQANAGSKFGLVTGEATCGPRPKSQLLAKEKLGLYVNELPGKSRYTSPIFHLTMKIVDLAGVES